MAAVSLGKPSLPPKLKQKQTKATTEKSMDPTNKSNKPKTTAVQCLSSSLERQQHGRRKSGRMMVVSDNCRKSNSSNNFAARQNEPIFYSGHLIHFKSIIESPQIQSNPIKSFVGSWGIFFNDANIFYFLSSGFCNFILQTQWHIPNKIYA